MAGIKEKIDETVPLLIEKIGSKINPFILNWTSENNQLLIFYFHGIYESDAQKEFHHVDPQNNVTVAQFEDFIDYFLSNNYNFIQPGDLLEGLEKDRPHLMMTFDDGYFNNSLALQVLQEYQVPATFFITARNVLTQKSYWWDIVYKYRKKEGISLQAIREEQEALKKKKYFQIDSYINEQFGEAANRPWSDIDRPFTAEELRTFSESPYVTIGNHTFHHTILTNYSKDKIREELESTNKVLTEIVGYTPQTLAFPNGNYDQRVLEVAREVGFKFSFTVRPRKNNLGSLPIPKERSGMICLDRFMTRPQDIRDYGSFCRIGYQPGLLYEQLKGRAMFYKRGSLLSKQFREEDS